MTSHKHNLAAKTVSKWQSLKSIFQDNLFRIVGTSEAETLESEKAECLLAIGKDQKSTKHSGVTFSFSNKSTRCSMFVNVMYYMYSQYTPVTLFQLSCETWLLQVHGQHSMP